MSKIYTETFDDGPGGWLADLHSPLPVWDGVAYCHSPWSVDANHAAPGAGYLHVLMYLHTHARSVVASNGVNRFVEGGFSSDLTDAKITARLRGAMSLAGPLCNNQTQAPETDLGGVQLFVHVQAHLDGPPERTANFILTGQPFEITPDWSEQTVQLSSDPTQWTSLGTRHDLKGVYGDGDIAEVLADVNHDIIFLLFPLNIVPVGNVDDRDHRWAGRDYKVDMAYLPKGLVMFDTVRIEYPE
jgi:hypothetical protein